MGAWCEFCPYEPDSTLGMADGSSRGPIVSFADPDREIGRPWEPIPAHAVCGEGRGFRMLTPAQAEAHRLGHLQER